MNMVNVGTPNMLGAATNEYDYGGWCQLNYSLIAENACVRIPGNTKRLKL